MTYKETIEFLYSYLPAYHRIGKAAYKDNLDNTQALDEYFGHPHRKFRSIHIAGTNGKGSVSHMMASVLQEAGYRTGLYTSPHLKDFRERIRVNGSMIPEEEVIGFVEKHHIIIENIKPSFFEMSVAMAFDFFARSEVEIAVVEVGLGGRLDSTNIISPVLSVITNIGHDHMDLLGGTLEKVAIEKAGIIKEHVPVIIGEKQETISDLFTAKANETGSEICFAESNFSCTMEDFDIFSGGRNFIIKETGRRETISGLTPLIGDYQGKNITTLFQVFKSVKDTLNLNECNLLDGIRNVIKNTGIQGRFQILNKSPLIICDTAHNSEGLEYVMRQVAGIGARKVHMIIGFVSDKDLSLVLPLFPVNAAYYFTRAAIPRALDEHILQSKAEAYGLNGRCYSTVGEALGAAKLATSGSDLIYIGGSTFIVAEII
jgi:dihydrofolate synthase/folylpolyglutamate synthase